MTEPAAESGPIDEPAAAGTAGAELAADLPSEPSPGEPADEAPADQTIADPAVEAAVRRLAGLADRPPEEHVEVYDDVHRALHAALTDAADHRGDPEAVGTVDPTGDRGEGPASS